MADVCKPTGHQASVAMPAAPHHPNIHQKTVYYVDKGLTPKLDFF
jgi:hypothetical protein